MELKKAKKSKSFFKKWYFWLSVVIHWLLFAPTDMIFVAKYLGSLVGSFIVVVIIFVIIRIIGIIIKKFKGWFKK